MKNVLFLILTLCFFSCQKNVDSDPPTSNLTTFDSLVGEWKYRYDFRLTATQSNPQVIIDSCCGYQNIYSPYSYLRLGADSSVNFFRTESTTLPAVGLKYMGTWKLNSINRTIQVYIEKETTDDYGPQTTVYNPPLTGPLFNIKYLSQDSLVTYYRLPAPDNKFYYWHDVYTR